MSLSINHNLMGINAHRTLSMTGNTQSLAASRLASGFRINSATDDAAGLAISERMRSQIRGLDQANRNVQDAISLIQVAESGLEGIHRLLERARVLTLQAANDTNDENERLLIKREIGELMQEIEHTSQNTQFNGIRVLQGSVYHISIHHRSASMTSPSSKPISPSNAADIQVVLDNYRITTPELMSFLSGTHPNVVLDRNGYEALLLSRMQSVQNALPGVQFNLPNQITAGLDLLELQLIQILGLGPAWEPVFMSVFNAVNDVFFNVNNWSFPPPPGPGGGDGGSPPPSPPDVPPNVPPVRPPRYQGGFHIQSGANSRESIHLQISRMDLAALGMDGFSQSFLEASQDPQGALLLSGIVDTVDNAIHVVSSQRALLGAKQNRLQHTSYNLSVSKENTSTSHSRIRDADMAREMMTLMRSNILQQAGMSMLAQANSNQQTIVSLLMTH